ncbi:MAG: GNAT family N-acetyltransferase, partial [Gemmatimonadetes bacterium]|nr:GNAT family N-acetyltransferase [Gemmatimonadota bacterium]
CRLGWRARHVYLGSLPAIRPASRGSSSRILDDLVASLEERGAAEVAMGSFDAEWMPEESARGKLRGAREEFHVALDSPDALLAQMGSTHRRRVRKGDSAGWRLVALSGEVGSEALYRVQVTAGQRARTRGKGFRVRKRVDLGESTPSEDWPWCGVLVFATYAGDELLAADMVGWAAGRAFYIRGGSTPAGYEASAAFWAHWTIMSRLGEAGLTEYNLGGVPGDAHEQGHSQHGLWRFKKDFGGRRVICRGWEVTLRPGHMKLHSVLNRLRGRHEGNPRGS